MIKEDTKASTKAPASDKDVTKLQTQLKETKAAGVQITSMNNILLVVLILLFFFQGFLFFKEFKASKALQKEVEKMTGFKVDI